MLIEGEWSCFLKRIVKCKCCISDCLRPKSKKYRLLDKGRKDLAVETDIVNLLKQLRAIWTILDIKLHLSKKQVKQVKESQRHTLRLFSDPEDSHADESNFIRKITLRHYDPSKVQSLRAEKKPEKETFDTLDPVRNLKTIQRSLV